MSPNCPLLHSVGMNAMRTKLTVPIIGGELVLAQGGSTAPEQYISVIGAARTISRQHLALSAYLRLKRIARGRCVTPND
jgi:hypothetical protein